MKLYKIAATEIFYRGTPTPETTPKARDFPGVFFSLNLHTAQNWGKNISKYEIDTSKLYKPNCMKIDQRDFRVVDRFINKYGFTQGALDKNWVAMGATPMTVDFLDSDNFTDVLSRLLLFPNKDWVNYLTSLGFNGYMNGKDVFLFNPSDAKYIGES